MLLSTKWERVKCRGHPKKSWVARIESLKKELELQNKVLHVKQIHNVIESKQFKEFEMGLKHKSKLCIYKELKREVGFEEYLEYIN